VDEERQDALVELAGRLGVQHHCAQRRPRARRDGDRDHRLEALLLELGHVLHARVGHRVLADELGRPVPRHPAGEPLVEAELHAADEVRVHLRGRAQAQAVAVAQVDEAGVAVGRLGEEVDDAVEHPVEVRRRRDDADDRVQRLAAQRDAVELRGGVADRRRAGHRRRLVGSLGGHGRVSRPC
jgi:hypothetical protein